MTLSTTDRPAAALPPTEPVPFVPTTVEPPRRAWVEQIMGMPISIHVRGPMAPAPLTARAVADAYAELRRIDTVFSTYREDSVISRVRRGEIRLADCPPEVLEVHMLCRQARERTDGWFDAWRWRDGFDPTGLVKGWAIARAGTFLEKVEGDVAIDAGGDVLVRSAADAPWRIGIEDPNDRETILAWVDVTEGAIATSGLAARGAHIIDPFTAQPVTGVLSATVVGPSILWADVMATAAVARGPQAVEWVETLPGTSGVLVLADGQIHRWSNPV
ncbi:FAD:protein FMN transferase [Cellulomonas soli]